MERSSPVGFTDLILTKESPIALLGASPLPKTAEKAKPDVQKPGRDEDQGRKNKTTLRRLIALIPFVILLPLFSVLAWEKGERSNQGMREGFVDDSIFYHDQHAYLNAAIMMRDSQYERMLPRHRMPGFSLLLSPLYSEKDAYQPDPGGNDPRRVSEGFFERAKRFNIALSVIAIVALFLICRLFLPPLASHAVTWTFAWLLAIFKAPYVQPEIIFYLLLLAGMVLLWQLLVRPRWWMAIAAALLLSGAFLLKSTVLPLMALFMGCVAMKLVADGWMARKSNAPNSTRRALKEAGICALVPLAFFVICLPYFWNTAKSYGSPLWDVHSRHYMWMDDDSEKRFWRNAGISDPDFIAPEGRPVPSVKPYFATHEFPEMMERVNAGWRSNLLMIHREYAGLDRMVWRLILFPLGIIAVICRRRLWGAFQKNWITWLLIAGFFIGYALLYSWYAAIGVGPRLFLALYLPALFFGAVAIHWFVAPWDLKVYRWRMPLSSVLFTALLIYVAISGIGVVTGELWVIEGGR